MEVKEDTKTKRQRKKPSRYKSFMSRISTVLSPSVTRKDSLKPKENIFSNFPQDRNSITSEQITGENSVAALENENEEPTYSDIKMFNQELNIDDDIKNSPPPPVPPKDLTELYAKVSKKKQKDNTSTGSKALSQDANQERISPISTSPDANEEDEQEIQLRVQKKITNGSTSEMLSKYSKDHSTKHKRKKKQEFKKLSKTKPLDSELEWNKLKTEGASYQRHTQKNVQDIHIISSPTDMKSCYSTIQVHTVQPEDRTHLEMEEFKFLQKQMYDITEENKTLRLQIQQFLQKEKEWKSEIAKAVACQQDYFMKIQKNDELKQQLTQLEIETKKEVHALCAQVKVIKDEKNRLLEQLQSLHNENQSVYKMYEQVCNEKKSMVTAHLHAKTVEDHQRQLEELTQKYKGEVAKLQEKLNSIEAEKLSSSVETELLKTDLRKLQSENTLLKNQKHEISTAKESLTQQIEEIRQHEYEALNLLATVLKVAEDVATERDIVLKKSEYQDQQQKHVHSTIIEYSMSVGRIQEHIENIRKRTNDEIQKAITSIQHKNINCNNLKQMYERQLSILRGKILQKTKDIDNLKAEKRKLEFDLQNLLETIHRGSKQTVKNLL